MIPNTIREVCCILEKNMERNNQRKINVQTIISKLNI